MVLPTESVVVIVETAPGSTVVVVYVDPAVSVLTITTGLRPVYPLEAVDVAVRVDGLPDTVVVLPITTGYNTVTVFPSAVVVTVTVAAEDGPAGATVESPPTVTVLVGCAARLLASFSAFLNAAAGIGEPAISQANCSGVNRRLLSRSLSQELCMQVIRSGRKFPAEARHKHPTSITPQLSS